MPVSLSTMFGCLGSPSGCSATVRANAARMNLGLANLLHFGNFTGAAFFHRSSARALPSLFRRCFSAVPVVATVQQENEQLLLVVGGGAAGVYASIRAKSIAPHLNVLVIEKGKPLAKGQFKDEFVTAGGVPLSEISLRTMESKIRPNLFFDGEILNVDGITGGFNFQNAWSGGYIAGATIGELASRKSKSCDRNLSP